MLRKVRTAWESCMWSSVVSQLSGWWLVEEGEESMGVLCEEFGNESVRWLVEGSEESVWGLHEKFSQQ